MMIPTLTACFGFLDSVEREREPWVGYTQHTFRGNALWLFGAPGAVLESIRIGNDEQLTGPLPFEAFGFGRPLRINDVRAMLLRGEHADLMNIANRPCQRSLSASPHVHLPTQVIGTQLWLRTSGLVSGVLLVGEQVTT